MKKKFTKRQIKKIKNSNKSLSLIEIRQKVDSKGVMVGANTELLVDGKPLKGAQSVRFEVSAKGVAKATVTLVGRFRVLGKKVLTEKIKLYK